MGLFSSSTKYIAHAGSSVLLEEATREDTVKSLMLQATIGGQTSLAEAVKLGLQSNMYARSRSMTRYANRPDGYTYGFPETDQDVLFVPSDDVQSAIEADIGESIENMTFNIGGQSHDDKMAQRLQEVWNDPAYFPWPSGPPLASTYNPAADEVEIPIDNPLHDPTGTPPVNQPYIYASNPPSYIMNLIGGIPTGSYTVTFTYPGGTWTVPQSITPAPGTGGDILTATFNRVSTPGVTEYWSYEIGTGGPLDAVVSSTNLNLNYLPIIILMQDTVWFDEKSDPDLEKTTKRILKRIALDPYDVKESYIESVEEAIENGDRPGEKKLDDWDFFIQFATPIHSRIRGSREIMYEYFKAIEPAMPTRAQYEAYLSSGGQQPYSEIHITEGGEQGFNAYYRYSYIASREVAGEYTPPGWTAPLRHNRAYSKIYKIDDADYAEGIEEMHGAGAAVASSQGKNEEHSYIIITRQQTIAGVPTYKQILVMGPSMKYVVNTRTDGDYRERDVEVELFPEDPEEESEFKIPVHISSLRAIPAMHREEALQDALCATVYLVEKQKVKWYQKSFFKWLIIIIVIVVVILAQQYQLLGTVANMASTAFAAGATATAVAYAALYVAMTFALGFMISFAGSLIGGDLGQLFVLAATIYMAGGNQIFSNIAKNWSAMVGNFGWNNATAFLSSIKPLVDVGQTIVNRVALADLESEMRDFEKTMREKYDELRDAWDQLGDQPSWLNPMDLVAVFNNNGWGEMPDSYFARTLNANPNSLGYDLLNHFYSHALMLPKDGSPDTINVMFEEMARQRGAA